ncbi:hypothetical protein [Mucisphaera calidilacus]|uniref:NfeD-like C-terminal domain-containing protein n=1 Tax=Mucisphaera calidilacus TaxID=2527982 RepID=A0A518BYJ2_9BACT|nr:hypothetical protein [Mucisphaera calidilacus]QDU72047.1 hypothetical protein Pan265_19070 [Mucisphaera calidilacus]
MLLDFLRLIFDWYGLLDLGVDATIYFVMAIAGTLFFLMKLGLSFFGGDIDYDIDTDFDTDAGSYSIFSLLSIVAFMMGAGWMGLIARAAWEVDPLPSGFMAGGFGLAMMFLAAGMMWGMAKLNSEPRPDLKTAVGKTAKVYMPIPVRGEGEGQVQVTVSGRLRTMPAASVGEAFETWATVRVAEVRDDGVLLVEPVA